MSKHASNRARELRLRISGGLRLRRDGVAGLYGFAWNDYETEAQPAFEALIHGHLLEFLRLVPAYGGSLIERAPFALLPGLWGGGALAVYRMVAAAVPARDRAARRVAVARMRTQRAARGSPVRSRSGVCVANPITLRALEVGHPEELLGACLCVAAVLLAAGRAPRSRAGAAGRCAAGPGDRQQGVGAARDRPGAARAAARVAAVLPGERVRCQPAAVLAAAGARRLRRLRGEHPRRCARRRQRDLPAVAAVVVLRPSRSARARPVRRGQARLPRRARRGPAPSATR